MTSKVTKLTTKAGGKLPVPEAPSYLSPEAREEWERIAPVLHDRSPLSPATCSLLEQYVAQVATVRQSEIAIAREGITLTGPNGIPRPHPLVGTKTRAGNIANQLAKRLGLFLDAEKATKGAGWSGDAYARFGVD
jgi:P27 family predicted phage terminase small subunit